MVFLLINGLFFWYFDGEFNILNNGYASLDNFFRITPWFLLFLIPALTMGMISEEKKQGTIELLLTHPIKESQIFLAKFSATLTLIILALLPTLIYVYSIYQLSVPVGNIDLGAIAASYFGLILISTAFTAIGMFSSTISDNQITCFISGILISVLFYYSFELISEIDFLTSINYSLKQLGMLNHFTSISRGVIDFSDIIYFLSLIVVFSGLAIVQIKKLKWNKAKRKSDLRNISILILFLILINYISAFLVYRFDFTSDKRFTLNSRSISIIEETDKDIHIQVLLSGDLPTGFKQLEAEVKRTLEDFKNYNSKISYSFIDPFEGKDNQQRDQILEELNSKGLSPINVEINKKGERKSKYIFPWALIKKDNKSVRVNLLKNKIGASAEQQLNNSIENIEYALVDAIIKINTNIKPKVAILKGHDELNDAFLADFLNSQHEYYHFERLKLNGETSVFELEKVIENYDALMVIKPGKQISEKEKLLIDQYIMKGGKSMWLLDGAYADMDSLLKDGKMLAFPRDLNLNDMLFKYGFRVNADIVKDLQFAPIKLASGNLGNNVQYHTVPWPYFPLSIPKSKHPIVKNIEAVKYQFASSIDTILSPEVRKTILLESSEFSKTFGIPNFIDFSEIQKELNENSYNEGRKILGLLLEGKFSSAFKNRILPFAAANYTNISEENKIIVFSDGDIIANQFQNGQPLPLGYDKWFNQQYGNKELIENSLSYLLDGSGILNIKKKEVTLRLLDKKILQKERTYWQAINIIFPVSILLIFAVLFVFIRKRKYKIN